MNDLSLGLRIARAQTVRNWRRRITGRRQLALIALFLLVLAPFVVIQLGTVYEYGRSLSTDAGGRLVTMSRHLVLPLFGGMVVLGVIQTMQTLASLSGHRLLLTTVTDRAFVLGIVLEDCAKWLLGFVVPAGLVIGAFALGFGSPILFVTTMTATLVLLLAALVAGYTIGVLFRVAILQLPLSPPLRRLTETAVLTGSYLLAGLGGAVFGQAFASAGGLGSLVETVPATTPMTPIGWYADLFFLGTPLQRPLSVLTVLAGSGVLVSIPVTFEIVVRLAPRLWYAETGGSSPRSADRTAERPPFTRQSDGVFRFRTVRIARAMILRPIRSPDRLAHLLYYFLLATVCLGPLVVDPTLAFTLGPALLVVCGVLFAGSVFCLNPLGDEGSMLQDLALSPTSPATVVHARLLAGVSVGLPVTSAGVLCLGLLSDLPISIQQLGAGLFLSVPLVVTSAAIGLGLGSYLPKFGTTKIFESVDVPAPSSIVLFVHTVLTLILTGVAVGILWLVTTEQTGLAGREWWLFVGTIAGLTVVCIDGCRRYAIQRLGWYGWSATDRPGDRILSVYTVIALTVLGFVVSNLVTVPILLVAPAFGTALDGVSLAVQFVVQYLGYLLVALGFLFVSERGLSALDVSVPGRRELRYAVGFTVCSIGLWYLYSTVAVWLGLTPSGQNLLEAVAEADRSVLLVLIPLVVFVNAPVEELLFRNVIQKSLREQFSARSAVVIASLCFSLLHVPAYFAADLLSVVGSLSLVFLLGCCWGSAYEYTGQLVVPALAHGVYNAVLIGLLYSTV